ncbi:acyltransferase [Bacteroidales bacterium OttesenSCG-928-K22]|nr:acyltransferase [Bacteroidales bacterium OttesenSCG-928-L14]MDL2240328.1 acyltransferase [Bacteroidales bacterium OttesenSCG-928-K22]
MEDINFDDIRPYFDEEIPYAMQKLADDESLYSVFKYVFPHHSAEKIKNIVLRIKNVDQMQRRVMFPVVMQLMSKTSTGLSSDGIENLNREKASLLISNHRDIVLDAGILQIILVQNKFNTTGITFGDNLLMSEMIRIIAKSNKLFIAYRGKDLKEFWNHSKKMSQYIRYQIQQMNQSVWIAQRNGRTKDGDDKTDQGVIKMLDMSRSDDFVQGFKDINISPCAVSYEYEPCDFLKTFELYMTRRGPYVKQEDEDLNSILVGIMQNKGGIHFSFAKPISEEEILEADGYQKNDKFRFLASCVDKRIYEGYKLWKTNYIAYDIVNNSNTFTDRYSIKEKENFVNYMNNGLNKIISDGFYGNKEFDFSELEEIFLNIYANPIKNKK